MRRERGMTHLAGRSTRLLAFSRRELRGSMWRVGKRARAGTRPGVQEKREERIATPQDACQRIHGFHQVSAFYSRRCGPRIHDVPFALPLSDWGPRPPTPALTWYSIRCPQRG
jgi:hypothetical protein